MASSSEKTCEACDATGECPVCIRVGLLDPDCDDCQGDGVCHECGGSGKD